MKKKTLFLLLPFLLAELGLWYCILFVGGERLSVFCYASVALACLFALCFLNPKSESIFLNLGLLTTVCADTFLVLPSPVEISHQIAGVAFFSGTQLFYFAFLLCSTENRKKKCAHGIIRIAVIAVAETVACIALKGKTDPLSLLSVFYVTNLVINNVFAYAQGKKGLLFGIGLTLFLCCDLFVGFSAAIGTYFEVEKTSLLYRIVFSDFNFIWFFYLPSQTLIALFTAKCNGCFNRRTKEKTK